MAKLWRQPLFILYFFELIIGVMCIATLGGHSDHPGLKFCWVISIMFVYSELLLIMLYIKGFPLQYNNIRYCRIWEFVHNSITLLFYLILLCVFAAYRNNNVVSRQPAATIFTSMNFGCHIMTFLISMCTLVYGAEQDRYDSRRYRTRYNYKKTMMVEYDNQHVKTQTGGSLQIGRPQYQPANSSFSNTRDNTEPNSPGGYYSNLPGGPSPQPPE